MAFSRKCVGLLMLAAAALPFAGCKSQNAPFIDPFAENVDTPTSGWGLRKLDPKDYPDMRTAWMDQTNLEKAIRKSLDFLAKKNSQGQYVAARFYPSTNPGDTITHAQEVATLNDILAMMQRGLTPDQFQQEVLSRYDVYTSVGYNNKGDVWFTAYFTPYYTGSRTRTAEFQYPIYSRPADLVTNPITGEVQGQYQTRKDLLASGKLKGLELLWFRKPMEPFMIQVQGSAKVHVVTDNTDVLVGYAGSNGREHKGLGSQLRDAGKIDARHLSLPAVIAYFDQHPNELDQYVLNDDRFTFLKIYTPEEAREWPTGSLNEQVTDDRSIATDKSIFPRASMTFVNVPVPGPTGAMMPHQALMLDQDTGGGIRAAGRADLYMGQGPEKGARAGNEFAQGRLYYMFLKPEFAGTAAAASATGTPRLPTAAPVRSTPAPAPARPAGPAEMFPGAVRPQ